MQFFENWPLKYYIMLCKIKDKTENDGKFYYEIENDEIINKKEANQLVQTKNYRLSETYLIVGERKLINKIYKSINNGEIPKIPEYITKKLEDNENKNSLIQRLKNKKLPTANYINKTKKTRERTKKNKIEILNINKNFFIVKTDILKIQTELKEKGGVKTEKGWLFGQKNKKIIQTFLNQYDNVQPDLFYDIPFDIVREYIIPYLTSLECLKISYLNKEFWQGYNETLTWKCLIIENLKSLISPCNVSITSSTGYMPFLYCNSIMDDKYEENIKEKLFDNVAKNKISKIVNKITISKVPSYLDTSEKTNRINGSRQFSNPANMMWLYFCLKQFPLYTCSLDDIENPKQYFFEKLSLINNKQTISISNIMHYIWKPHIGALIKLTGLKYIVTSLIVNGENVIAANICHCDDDFNIYYYIKDRIQLSQKAVWYLESESLIPPMKRTTIYRYI